MSRALRSSSPYQSNNSLHGAKNAKDPVSPTQSYDPLSLEQHNGEISLGLSRLVVLTCGIGGLQVIWSVVLSQGAPFLVSIGLSKSSTALVWIAGPFCGAFIQPIVGYLSDRSRFSWGQRRPFIVIGAVSTILSIWMLAWTESGIQWVMHACHLELQKEVVAEVVIAFAVFWIYVLNISIQPLQLGLRALVIENCPSHQQAQANTWASLMTGVGNIFGYAVGFAPLPDFLQYLCQTQFQGLCVIASFAVTTTVSITCCFIHERSSERLLLPLDGQPVAVMIARRLLRTFRNMPLKTRRVLRIQFFAWMGWFPYLFYATTYVGDLYSHAVSPDVTETYQFPPSTTRRTSTQVGTFAIFLSGIVALTANFLLQFIIRPISNSPNHTKSQPRNHFIRRFTISQVWTLTHVSFAVLMFSTLLVKTHIGGTVLIAFSGVSWAMTLWAPYAIIGQELAAKENWQQDIGKAELESSDENQAGMMMSLHNSAVSIPQIAAALVCSGIFWISKIVGSQDGVAWCLRAGGVAALAAAWISSGFGDI